MKKNKKLLYALLFGIAMFTLAPNVYADSPATFGAEGGSQNIDVQAVVDKKSVIEGKEYYVVISWTSTNGVYTSQDVYSWDAVNLKYVKATEGDNTTSLTGEKAKTEITITNQSNGAIKYSIEYATAENMDTTENAEEGYENSGLVASAVAKEYQLPETFLDTYKDTNYMTAKTSTYKGEIALNKYSTSGEVKLGTYTVNISKAMLTDEDEEVATLSYTGEAIQGEKITISGRNYVVLSNENGIIRAMDIERIGSTAFSSSKYWMDDYDNGILKQFDQIDLFHSENLVRPMLDEYAEMLGIDKTSVTLPTMKEMNGVRDADGVYDMYWLRTLSPNGNPCMFINFYVNHDNPSYVKGVHPVVVIAA